MKLKNANHIIEKVLLEVSTSSAETAHSIKNNIDVFLNDELFPQLEMLFDEYRFQNEIVRFDEININLSLNKWDDFKGLKSEIYNQLKEKIDNKANKGFQSENVNDNELIFGKKDVQKVSADLNTSEVFLFFLENGHLPWFGKEEHINNFIQAENWIKNLENDVFLQKLDRLFKTKELVIERFILQFSDDIITGYLSRANLNIKKQVHGIRKIGKTLNHDSRRLFLKLMFRITQKEYDNLLESLSYLESTVSKSEKPLFESKTIKTIQEIKEIVRKVIPTAVLIQSNFTKIKSWIDGKPNEVEGFENDDSRKLTVKDRIEEEIVLDKVDAKLFNKVLTDTNKTETIEKDKETELKDFQSMQFDKNEKLAVFDKGTNEFWVRNAGLIVLHPFIKPFFIATGITDKLGKFLVDNYDLPVQSLHYLATGDENFFEGNLIFEKFLCGVPLKMPVSQTSVLTDIIKTEASVLLNEVVKNWPALKNTSADGLRQMFIQRDGKLIQKEDSYKLIVERKAQDVLLEKLSWNISMIKLPWISKILFIEW